jgi:hypothetical protein
MVETQFGGRFILRDGQGEVDLEINIDDESISLVQGEETLGTYSLREVQYVRMTPNRVRMSFDGEAADFYPYRPEEFIATLLAKNPPI